MQSFLNRKQFVNINGVNSATEQIMYGVAQGSSYTLFYFCSILMICPAPQTVFCDFLMMALALLSTVLNLLF